MRSVRAYKMIFAVLERRLIQLLIKWVQFLPRDAMLSAVYATAIPSVCPSVRPSVCPYVYPSHGWISQKRLKLGSCNFQHTVAPSL